MAHRDVSSGSYDNRAPMAAPKLPAKELDHLRVREAENAGHVVEHHFTSGMHESETHVFGPEQGAEALAHIAKHAHIKNEKPMQDMEDKEEEGGY
jgi:hypothetical protein